MTDIQAIEFYLHLNTFMTESEIYGTFMFMGKSRAYIASVLKNLVEDGNVQMVKRDDKEEYYLNYSRYETFTNANGGSRVRRKYHTEPHNKDYKLIRQWIATDGGYIHLIYGETNQGDNKGVEAYYYRDNAQGHHHYSRRWPLDKVPNHFRTDALYLQELIPYCPDGHKLYVP